MPQARKFDAGHVAALAIAVALHAVFAWLILHSRGDRDDASAERGALQVAWIERPAPEPSRPAEPPPESPRERNATPPRDAATAPARPESVAHGRAAPEPSRPLSAVFIDQGRQFARTQADAHDFVQDPFANRRHALSDVRGGGFRMREAVTPAKVLAGIGQLFGGPGYETDPCPRIRRNIAALGPGGDSELLQEEFRRQRQFCQ